MSLNLELIKNKSALESLAIALISVVLSILSIVFLSIIFGLVGYEIDLKELYDFGFVDIFYDKRKSEINWRNILAVLYWSTPLIFTGLAVAIAFQAGLFNIGAQGQMAIGGVFAAIWAASILPDLFPEKYINYPIIVIPTMLFIGFAMGGFWGFIAGYLKAKTGAHEVIVTILLNIIAVSFINYLIGIETYSPFVDPKGDNLDGTGDSYNRTKKIITGGRLGPIFPSVSSLSTQFTIAFVFAVITAIIFYFVISKTTFGFKLRAVGLNAAAAEASGINTSRMTILAMTISGGVAGIGGALFVMNASPSYRYQSGMEGTLGFDGIAVALIGQNSPMAIVFTAIFFGFLSQSSSNLDFKARNVSPEIIDVLQSLIIIFVVAPTIARSIMSSARRFEEDKPQNANGKEIPKEKEITNGDDK